MIWGGAVAQRAAAGARRPACRAAAGRPRTRNYNGRVNLAVGLVCAALVASLVVVSALLARTLGTLKRLKAGISAFQAEAEPLAREVAGMAEQVAQRAEAYHRAFGGPGTNAGANAGSRRR